MDARAFLSTYPNRTGFIARQHKDLVNILDFESGAIRLRTQVDAVLCHRAGYVREQQFDWRSTFLQCDGILGRPDKEASRKKGNSELSVTQKFRCRDKTSLDSLL